MDLIFHGPLGMELSLDRSAGVPRVKAAEHDSPALLVVGRALTAIEGVPVGEIRDKKSWLAVVAKLQAPERPLSLSFEAPAAPPPEEDPIAAEERARAELQPVAERAECALSTEHIEERFLARERARMAKDYRTADAIERELTLAGVLHDKARWWIPGTSREGPMPCARDTGALCRYYSAGRPCPHGDRCQFLHADDSRPGERVPVASSAPALGERPTRRHLVAATESEPAARGPMPSLARDAPAAPPVPREAPVGLCPPDDVIRQRLVERALAKLNRDFRRADAIQADLARAGVHTSDVKGQVKGLVRWTTTDGRSGPKPPSDSEIYDMVLACERAKHTGASSQMIRPMVAEMTISGVVTENRDRSGRAHPHGALRWCCVDGRTGPPKMSEIDIEARVREWARARKDRNFRRSDELEVELAARGVRVDRELGWFTAGPGGLSGPIPSLARDAPAAPPVPREAPVGTCPPDDVIRQRLVERQVAKLQRDFHRADTIEADLARVGVHVSTTRKSLVRWKTTDGRSGPKPPSDSEIYDMMLAFEQARDGGRNFSETIKRMAAEMTVSGVVICHFDRTGTRRKHGALRWFCVDGRSGPPKMSERDIEARVREWARAQADRNFRRSDELRADLAARGVRVDPGQWWFTAGPGELAGPIPSLDRKRSRSHSPRRSRHDTAPGKRPRPPSPGLGQRPTRRHLVAAAPAPSEASSSDGF